MDWQSKSFEVSCLPWLEFPVQRNYSYKIRISNAAHPDLFKEFDFNC